MGTWAGPASEQNTVGTRPIFSMKTLILGTTKGRARTGRATFVDLYVLPETLVRIHFALCINV